MQSSYTKQALIEMAGHQHPPAGGAWAREFETHGAQRQYATATFNDDRETFAAFSDLADDVIDQAKRYVRFADEPKPIRRAMQATCDDIYAAFTALAGELAGRVYFDTCVPFTGNTGDEHQESAELGLIRSGRSVTSERRRRKLLKASSNAGVGRGEATINRDEVERIRAERRAAEARQHGTGSERPGAPEDELRRLRAATRARG